MCLCKACKNVSYLSDERDDSLCAILVHIWQIDLITEQHQPLAQLDRSEDHAVRGTAVLAVMIKGFQQQFRGGGAGEVQTHNLEESTNWLIINADMIKIFSQFFTQFAHSFRIC